MGIGVTVHGVIEFPGWGKQAASVRVFRHNRAVMRSLPSIDPDWPFVTGSMFAMAPYRPTNDVQVPQYEVALIHFAGSYKDMYFLPVTWIRKFETILSRLCCYRAVVYNEFTGIQYRWEAKWSEETFLSDPPRPAQIWALKCYEGERKEIPHAKAIDGYYSGFLAPD